jgi:intracellular multiplication protein IcmE
MTNNENENEVDIDAQEDFEGPAAKNEKASLKDTWDSNPLLKIAAVILGLGLLGAGYFTFIGSKEELTNASGVGGGTEGVKVIPGTDNADEDYKKMVQKQNQQQAQQAVNEGTSAMPTPVDAGERNTLDLPPQQNNNAADPLAEWRQKTEAKRLAMEQESVPEQEVEQAPEVVPMVQPIHPQPTVKMDPAVAKALADQMRVVILAQEPKNQILRGVTRKDSLYTIKVREDNARKAKEAKEGKRSVTAISSGGDLTYVDNVQGGTPTTAVAPAKTKIIITAGTISYAQLLNDLNSDVKGPVLAQILSGPFEGGRAIGEFKVQDDYLTLSFKRIIKDSVSYSVDGIALDEKTTLTGLNSDVDNHYLSRVFIPVAADFIKGYADAVTETGTSSTTTAGGGVVQDQPEPTGKEELYEGIKSAADKVGELMKEEAPDGPTIKLKRGTTMGILFLSPVTTGNVEQ